MSDPEPKRVSVPRSVRAESLEDEGPGFYLWDEDSQEMRPASDEFALRMAARRAQRRERRRTRRVRFRPEPEPA